MIFECEGGKKGPAYDQPLATIKPSSDEWHTYRQTPKRSGATTSHVPIDLSQRWSTMLGGHLVQPIVADGKAFVASKDAGTVHCLDLGDGALSWSRAVSGPIDSPPSYHEGFVIFGSRDGYVYSIRAQDGTLAWRFRAAPRERQVVSHGRLESAWPAHGSVLIHDGLIAANRQLVISTRDGAVVCMGQK